MANAPMRDPVDVITCTTNHQRGCPQPGLFPRGLSTSEAEGAGSETIITFFCPPVFAVSGERVLRIPGGEWLERRRIMTPLTIFMCIVTAALELLRPGKTIVTVQTLSGEYSVQRSGRVYWYLFSFFALSLWALIMHQMNRRVFIVTLFSFESVVIFASAVQGQLAFVYNLYDVFGRAGVFDREWQILEIVSRSVSYPLGSIFLICTFDAWMLRRKYRILICFIFIATFSYIWVKHRFFEHSLWSIESKCFWLWCGPAKSVFIASTAQIIVFLSKSLFIYARGLPFAHIHPHHFLKSVSSTGDVVNVSISNPGKIGKGSCPTMSLSFPLAASVTSAAEVQLMADNLSLRAQLARLRDTADQGREGGVCNESCDTAKEVREDGVCNQLHDTAIQARGDGVCGYLEQKFKL